MALGLQLSILVERLRQRLNHPLQWVALSATVGNLTYIRDFLFSKQEKSEFLSFSSQRPIDAHVRAISDETELLKLFSCLLKINPPTKLLVFCNSRRECERFAALLKENGEISADILTHYSSLSPEIRLEIEKKFSQPKSTSVCIATSTLELGIDIGDINAVVLWGVPNSIESFLQRIGRSNRRENKTNVICLIPDQADDPFMDALRFLTLIDMAQLGEMPVTAPYRLFGSVSQQLLSYIASKKGSFTQVSELCSLIQHKRYIERTDVEEILFELAEQSYLQKHGFKNRFGADQNLFKLVDYRMIYGNFSSGSKTIEIRHKSKVLGEAPSDNLMRMRQGSTVRFAGSYWEVADITFDHMSLEPTKSNHGVIDFSYSGKGMVFDTFIYNYMWDYIHSQRFSPSLTTKSLGYAIQAKIQKIVKSCQSNQIPYAETAHGFYYFTFGGLLINKSIALINHKQDFLADNISLSCKSPINWSILPGNVQDYCSVFSQLFERASKQSIFQELLPEKYQAIESIDTWLKSEVVSRVLDRLSKAEPVKVNEILRFFNCNSSDVF